LPKRTKNLNEIYTLVLDLDETLIHYDSEKEVDEGKGETGYLIRPGALEFIDQLSEYYELVVFTAGMPDYADWVLDGIDKERKIAHRLYR